MIIITLTALEAEYPAESANVPMIPRVEARLKPPVPAPNTTARFRMALPVKYNMVHKKIIINMIINKLH